MFLATINPFQKHVRLCELVKASPILHLCQGLQFFPYDLTRTFLPYRAFFEPGRTGNPASPMSSVKKMLRT